LGIQKANELISLSLTPNVLKFILSFEDQARRKLGLEDLAGRT